MPAADSMLSGAFDERLAFLQGQLANADLVLQVHRPAGAMCSCGRRQPCVHGDSVAARRRDFEQERAALLGPTVVVMLVCAKSAASTPDSGRPAGRRRWWSRRRR